MALPWVRLDSNIASHDKILAMISGSSPHRWRAAAVFQFAIGWSGGAGTDGLVPFYALAQVHGTKPVAALLVEYRLWAPDPEGWRMRNFPNRQQLAATTEAIRAAQSIGAQKANCVRWHGPECGCWTERAK